MIQRLKEGHHEGITEPIIVVMDGRVSFSGQVNDVVVHEGANVRIAGDLAPYFVINRGALVHVMGSVAFDGSTVVEGELQVQGILRGPIPASDNIYLKAGGLVQATADGPVLEVCPDGHLVPHGTGEVIPAEAGPKQWLQWNPQLGHFQKLV